MSRLPLALSLILGLQLLGATAQAASETAEQAYQRGLAALQHLQQLTAQPDADTQALEQAMERFDTQMQAAADRDHPVARLYLARMALETPGQDQRQQACASLDELGRGGFVAAAVTRFQLCDEAFKRFRFDDPEHLMIIDALERSLTLADPAAEHYPLGTRASQCFPGQQSLNQAQWRSEAAYIIGSSRPKDAREGLQNSLRWLDRAFDEGCSAGIDVRPTLRKQLAQAL